MYFPSKFFGLNDLAAQQKVPSLAKKPAISNHVFNISEYSVNGGDFRQNEILPKQVNCAVVAFSFWLKSRLIATVVMNYL